MLPAVECLTANADHLREALDRYALLYRLGQQSSYQVGVRSKFRCELESLCSVGEGAILYLAASLNLYG